MPTVPSGDDDYHSAVAGDTSTNIPDATFAGLSRNLRYDLVSGFLVFLIALPLCLGIANASGFPAIAGVFTAIVGGLATPWLSNSQLTIKGPAAGLIVIVLGAVDDFRGDVYPTLLDERAKQVASYAPATKAPLETADNIQAIDAEISALNQRAYRLTLGVGAVAAILQIGFGLCRGGALGDFFPTSAVHGLLASIGIIIIGKKIHEIFGALPHGKEPLEQLAEIPHSIQNANWAIAAIGLLSLVILFGLPLIRISWVRKIPGPLVVLLVAAPLGLYFNLSESHTLKFMGREETVGPNYLVTVPNNFVSAITTPDFSGVMTVIGMKWALMFVLIGTLESMLSAKAIDLLDPWRRKTDLNRDVLAVGVANFASACVGGLPMISEIVRSSANINYGGRTRFANLFHGLFLLLAVALLPALIHLIPLAALAAMLCYAGYRLASPKEFFNVYRVGREQLVIFLTTIVVTLATDLLVGIAAGIAVKWLIHMINGMSIRTMFRPDVEMADREDGTHVVLVRNAIVFSNWILFKRRIEALEDADVVLDLSETKLVDHTAMEKLHELEQEFSAAGRQLIVIGLDNHRPMSKHPHAARKLVLGAGG